MLTGATPATGTLVNLSYDIGPAYYNLAIQSGDRVLFPIQRRGWAVHDGSRLIQRLAVGAEDPLQPRRAGRVELAKSLVQHLLSPGVTVRLEHISHRVVPDPGGRVVLLLVHGDRPAQDRLRREIIP
jgi:hypothetical protein